MALTKVTGQGIGSIDTEGTIKLDGNYPTGTSNVALGDTALDDGSLSGGNNVAIGSAALTANTSGSEGTAVGQGALSGNTTGTQNTAVGRKALEVNTEGAGNTAVGQRALDANTTADNNTAVGMASLGANTTGASNTALGQNALASNSSGSSNVAIGSHAGYTTTTTGDGTFVGVGAGQNATSADHNTYIGRYAGGDMTSGTKNTIIGRYAGNSGGLDIRTSSSNIVLSDGNGNPRLHMDSNGHTYLLTTYANTTGGSANVHIGTSGELFRSTSSQRYKNTIADATHGLTELLALRPVTYKHNGNGDTVFGGLIAEEVHDAGLTEFVDYSQDDNGDDQPEALHYANMVSLCIKAIQEQQATITALTARITALETE